MRRISESGRAHSPTFGFSCWRAGISVSWVRIERHSRLTTHETMAYQTAIQTSKSILFTTAAALLMALTSCQRASNPHIDYLNTAVGNASEDRVVSTWGPPSTSRPLTDSAGEIWVYRFRSSHAFAGVNCTEYILTFDGGKVLRNWTQSHGCQEPVYPH